MKRSITLILLIALSGCANASTRVAPVAMLQQKAEQNDSEAQFQLATELKNNGQLSQAAFWYRRAANLGNLEAQVALATLFEVGEGVPQSYAEAAYWYWKAADRGHLESLTQLGSFYDRGLGVEKDPLKALVTFQQGAEGGSAGSMLHLGMYYWEGKGTTADLVLAHMWLDLAHNYAKRSDDPQIRKNARTLLAQLKQEMTPSQIKEAERFRREWAAAH